MQFNSLCHTHINTRKQNIDKCAEFETIISGKKEKKKEKLHVTFCQSVCLYLRFGDFLAW